MIKIKLYKIKSEDKCNYEQIFETTACQYWVDTERKQLSWRMNVHACSVHLDFESVVADNDNGVLELTVFLTSENAQEFMKWWYANSWR